MAKAPKPPFDLPPAPDAVDPLAREALGWIVHLHSGDEVAADWASFEDWKAASSDHARAAEKAMLLWQGVRPALRSLRRSKSRRVAIGLVAALGLGAAAGALEPTTVPSLLAAYGTATGELRTVTLKDGSIVDLDTATAFDVSADHRTLTLHAGQIHVTVAPDPDRPFRVVTGKAEVKALGTAFAVRIAPETERVVVTEHAVQVTAPSSAPQASVRLTAGQSVEIGRAGLGVPRDEDVGASISWRAGELHFLDRPLSAVVAEIERYRRGRIVIVGDDLARLPVTGNFDVRNTDAFIDAAVLALPIRIVRLPALVVMWRDSSRGLPAR